MHKNRYRHVVRAVYENPWAILPEKLDAIRELLAMRARGDRFSKAEIRARIGEQRAAISPQPTVGQVAVISVIGSIMPRANTMSEISGAVSCEAISRAFDAALNDPNVTAIVLDVDSPGGTVGGVQELAAKIYAARGQKRIVALANTLAASAAYWIASAAEEFVVTPSGTVGSIGVFTIATDYSQMDAELGIKHTVVQAGKYKAEFAVGPYSEEAIAALQQRIDAIYSTFVEAVAQHRGVTPAKVEAGYGQGRVLLAQEALAAGMVDRIATLEEVLQDFGVGAAASGPQASAPAYTLKGITMNPKIFGKLVRIGLVELTDTQAQADAALDKFLASKGLERAAGDEAIVKALDEHVAAMKPTAGTGTQQLAAVVGTLDLTASDDRAADILAAVRLAGLPDGMQVAQTLIADKTLTVSAALRKINELAAKGNPPVGSTQITAGAAERDKFRVAARDSLLLRTWGNNSLPERVFDRRQQDYVAWQPQGRGHYGLQSLPRLAETCLVQAGVPHEQVMRLAPHQLAQAALGVARLEDFGIYGSDGPAYNTSGMFTNVLFDAANIQLRRSYDDARTTFQIWAQQAESIPDFKPTHAAVAGELGDPRAVPEDGEFEETTMLDAKESYRLVVWGQMFSCTYQMIVNDQLGAFMSIQQKQSNAMRRKQNRLVYGVLKDNPTMADTGALFNATAVTTAGGHANLTTGAGAPSVATLNTLTKMMAEQRGLNTTDGGALNIQPRFLLHCPALRGTVLQLLGSQADPAGTNSGAANIWQKQLTPVDDAELGLAFGGSDTAWYLSADHREGVDTVHYAYLRGLETPALDYQASFSRLAVRYRIYQAFATKAIDFRGLQKHAGA